MSQQDMGERAARTNKIGRKAGSELLQRIVFMVAVAVVVFIIVTIGLYFLNYYWFSKERTDIGAIVQPALGIVAGIGAVAYLVIAYRKQKNAEDGIIDRRMVTAIEQLASESPQKRIAGVYALAEISDTYKGEYKQRVVDILCGYLRTDRHGKYTQEIIDYVENQLSNSESEVGSKKIKSPDAPVESTILRVMHERLLKNRPDLGDEFKDIQLKETDQLWCDCRFDFHGAVFVEEIDLSSVSFHSNLIFDDAIFCKTVAFSYASFKQEAFFNNAIFIDKTYFSRAKFRIMNFDGASFKYANFIEAECHAAEVWGIHFKGAGFCGACFDEIHLTGANFVGAAFRNASFGTVFFGNSKFDCVHFGVLFLDGARFKKLVHGCVTCTSKPTLDKIIFESGEIPEAFAKYMTEDEKDYATNPARWPEEKD